MSTLISAKRNPIDQFKFLQNDGINIFYDIRVGKMPSTPKCWSINKGGFGRPWFEFKEYKLKKV